VQEAANAAAIAATIKRFVLIANSPCNYWKKMTRSLGERKKRAGRKAATQEWLRRYIGDNRSP
jgi:hypothetical protein